MLILYLEKSVYYTDRLTDVLENKLLFMETGRGVTFPEK